MPVAEQGINKYMLNEHIKLINNSKFPIYIIKL